MLEGVGWWMGCRGKNDCILSREANMKWLFGRRRVRALRLVAKQNPKPRRWLVNLGLIAFMVLVLISVALWVLPFSWWLAVVESLIKRILP